MKRGREGVYRFASGRSNIIANYLLRSPSIELPISRNEAYSIEGKWHIGVGYPRLHEAVICDIKISSSAFLKSRSGRIKSTHRLLFAFSQEFASYFYYPRRILSTPLHSATRKSIKAYLPV